LVNNDVASVTATGSALPANTVLADRDHLRPPPSPGGNNKWKCAQRGLEVESKAGRFTIKAPRRLGEFGGYRPEADVQP